MKEAIAGEVNLAEVDLDSFIQLRKYACIRPVQSPETGPTEATDDMNLLRYWLRKFSCLWCGALVTTKGDHRKFPFCSTTCGAIFTASGVPRDHCVGRGIMITIPTPYTEKSAVLCGFGSACRALQEMLKSQKALPGHLSSLFSAELLMQNPSACAKLYILAGMYVIDQLKQLCLTSLGRKLSTVKIDETKVTEIVEMLQYVDKSTGAGDYARRILHLGERRSNLLWAR